MNYHIPIAVVFVFAYITGSPAQARSPDAGWLSAPDSPGDLASNRPLVFLAGHLIQAGLVSVTDCSDQGLQANGTATPCGLERARSLVYRWQNHFDPIIFAASQQTSVPAYLLKGLFAQETQFWPATTHNAAWLFGEYGLGQLNDQGADTLLLWNRDFYHKLCPSVFRPEFCWPGYANLPESMRAVLRGAVLGSVAADCPTCELGLDMPKVDESIVVFAEAVLANHRQAGQVIRNLTGLEPVAAVGYEDLWRYTLVNYHAGAGCLYAALIVTQQAGENLTWERVSPYFETGCGDVVSYVENVSRWP